MPACATRETIQETAPIRNLLLPVPDTDFRAFLDEVDQLLRFAPEIIPAIEGDLDARALAKKKLRLEDRRFFASQTEDLPELQIEESEPSNGELALEIGRVHQEGRSQSDDRLQAATGPQRERFCYQPAGSRGQRGRCHQAGSGHCRLDQANAVVADLVSTDDGYASAKGRDDLREMGIANVSISGAKGKKLVSFRS